MTPAEAARTVASDLYCAGAHDDDRLARAFEKFADLLDPPQPDPITFSESCCGECSFGNCYVDQMTGA